MKKLWRMFMALLLAAALLGGCRAVEDKKTEGALPDMEYYTLWHGDDCQPRYVRWLPDGRLLAACNTTVEQDDRLWRLDILRTEDAGSARDRQLRSLADGLSYNFFFDVRAFAEEDGAVYLQNKFVSQAQLWAYDPAQGQGFAALPLPQGRAEDLSAYLGEGRWLEIGRGELWLNSEGERTLLAEDGAIGRPWDSHVPVADWDISDNQSFYAQLDADGLLTLADLTGTGEASSFDLPQPEGWLYYTYLQFLPGGEALAAVALCEDKVVVQMTDRQGMLLAEYASGDVALTSLLDGGQSQSQSGWDLALMRAPDADRLLFIEDKRRVALYDWREGTVELLFDGGEMAEMWNGLVEWADYDAANRRLAVAAPYQSENGILERGVIIRNY